MFAKCQSLRSKLVRKLLFSNSHLPTAFKGSWCFAQGEILTVLGSQVNELRTMGTTCLGTYVIHTQLAGHEWIGILTLPLPYITHQSLHPWLNCFIVLLYNVAVCVVFAHTIGAGFHRLLVFLSKVARPSWPQVA